MFALAIGVMIGAALGYFLHRALSFKVTEYVLAKQVTDPQYVLSWPMLLMLASIELAYVFVVVALLMAILLP